MQVLRTGTACQRVLKRWLWPTEDLQGVLLQNKKAGREKKNVIDELQRQLQEARLLRLQSFTPRELMLELKRRGYEGTFTYTEVHTIELSKLE